MAKGKGKRKIGAGDVASNRYASHRYELIERLECGIVLEGTEVKALRTSGAQLKDGYASITKGELWLHSVHIPPYGPASRENHDPGAPPHCTLGFRGGFMILPFSDTSFILLMLLCMLCWGSWPIFYKLAKKYRFELFYFDFGVGLVLVALIGAFTVGNLGFDGFNFSDDLLNARKQEW